MCSDWDLHIPSKYVLSLSCLFLDPDTIIKTEYRHKETVQSENSGNKLNPKQMKKYILNEIKVKTHEKYPRIITVLCLRKKSDLRTCPHVGAWMPAKMSQAKQIEIHLGGMTFLALHLPGRITWLFIEMRLVFGLPPPLSAPLWILISRSC